MRNASLDKVQTGIKVAGRNINDLKYAEDTALMAEYEEELESLLMKEKKELRSLMYINGKRGTPHSNMAIMNGNIFKRANTVLSQFQS